MMKGMLSDAQHDEPRALRAYSAAAAADSDFPGVHAGLGLIEWKLDHLRRARRQLQAEIRHFPDTYLGHYIMGRIEIRSGHPRHAMRHLARAAKLRPASRMAWMELARARLELGQVAGAEKNLRQALRLDPNFARAHYLLGTVFQRQGKTNASAHQRAICAGIHAARRRRARNAARATQSLL